MKMDLRRNEERPPGRVGGGRECSVWTNKGSFSVAVAHDDDGRRPRRRRPEEWL